MNVPSRRITLGRIQELSRKSCRKERHLGDFEGAGFLEFLKPSLFFSRRGGSTSRGGNQNVTVKTSATTNGASDNTEDVSVCTCVHIDGGTFNHHPWDEAASSGCTDEAGYHQMLR